MALKPIRFTKHALEQCAERGASHIDVTDAIRTGEREVAKHGRTIAKKNFQFDAEWAGRTYAVKQVAPVFIEEETEIVVVTVYTYYF